MPSERWQRTRLARSGQRNRFYFVFVLQQAAPDAACFFCLQIEVRVTMNRVAHDPNVRTAGATGNRADKGKSADDNK